jgi:hypothetical protein
MLIEEQYENIAANLLGCVGARSSHRSMRDRHLGLRPSTALPRINA